MNRSKSQKLFYYQNPGVYNKKYAELVSTEEKTVRILKDFPETRNSDTELMFQFWYMFDNMSFSPAVAIAQKKLGSITPAETITRCRRYIQNELGLFLPTDEKVLENRKISSLAVKDWACSKVRMSWDA